MKKLDLNQMFQIHGGYNGAFRDGFCFASTWGSVVTGLPGLFLAAAKPETILASVAGGLAGAGTFLAINAIICEATK
ncbi:hypothetical protein [Thermoflexibacter ruber]|uniref:Uncharacterized protein n=1 Tax=Thermoflexibacter ruber TaxID=1003 RepID=A0A1I2JRL5_9BACT|nr:hypothetical protein [Thermoflexibacter ruber]SFF56839.1 hypothetical protein SAMN04488541_106014 [Thermoflexibacter ruber]